MGKGMLRTSLLWLFAELKQKVTSLFDGDLVLKYQLSPEDLDALVSVKSDEDLRHMLDEYERQEGEGTPRLRAFLFPSAPVVLDVQITSTDPHALEQRYIDAINGIVRIRPTLKIIPPKPSLASFTISSACSSPNSLSPDPFSHDSTTSHESVVPRGALMHKVRSSPSLYSPDQQTADTHLSSPLVYQHPNHYHQNYQQYHHPGFQSARPPQDPSKGAAGERSTSGLSKGRTDSGRGLMGSGPSSYYSSARQHKGFGSSNKYVHLEEGSSHGGQKAWQGRYASPEPAAGHLGVKPCGRYRVSFHHLFSYRISWSWFFVISLWLFGRVENECACFCLERWKRCLANESYTSLYK